MTTPGVVLPQFIVEAAVTPGQPVKGAGTITLDDPAFGLLDTDFLAGFDAWADISQYVLGWTITQNWNRVAGPLIQFQAGTASITLDNSDGRFDPDNLTGPYVSGGVSQIHAMTPIRIRAVFGNIAYPLFRGFADAWLETPAGYSAGYSEWVVNATDAFKVLAGITVPAVGVALGATEDTGARVNRVLNAAAWYTGQGGGARMIDRGDQILQGTLFGDTALNLIQLAADTEAGQVYVDGSGAVVFRRRKALLNDARSQASQAAFGDLPGAPSAPGVTWAARIADTAQRFTGSPGGYANTTTVSGDLLVAAVTSTTGSTVGFPAGWFLAGTADDGVNIKQTVWYYPSNPGGITSTPVTFTGSFCDIQITQFEPSASAPRVSVNAFGGATNSGSNTLTMSTTTGAAQAGDLVYVTAGNFISGATTASFTSPTLTLAFTPGIAGSFNVHMVAGYVIPPPQLLGNPAGVVAGTQTQAITTTPGAGTIGTQAGIICSFTSRSPAWQFTPSGTPGGNNFFIVNNGQAPLISAGDWFTDVLNPGIVFVVTSVGGPAFGFNNIFYTPSSAVLMDATDTVTQIPPHLPLAAVGRADDDTTIFNDIQATIAGSSNMQEQTDSGSVTKYLFPRTYARADLISMLDSDAAQWAGWVLLVGKTAEDRFDTVTIDPAAQPLDLWPQVLGRQQGDRITVYRHPPKTGRPVGDAVTKDGFIAGISHTFDATQSAWSTTWTLQDAARYGGFLSLDQQTLGQLDHNPLAY